MAGWFWGNSGDDSSYDSSEYTSDEDSSYEEVEHEEGDSEENEQEEEDREEEPDRQTDEEALSTLPDQDEPEEQANEQKAVNGHPDVETEEKKVDIPAPPPPVDTGNLKEDEFDQLLSATGSQQSAAEDTAEAAPKITTDTVALVDQVQEEETEEHPEVTSTSEKQSLLMLAAEHDRVDILNTILEESKELLNPTNLPPPLHIAVSYGSVNAVNCLLRMGADPSIRPEPLDPDAEFPVETPKLKRYVGKTAWELANGSRDDNNGSWSGMFRSNSGLTNNVAPSKMQNIRNSFTMEALRCLGGDENDRLEQLLNSGMPKDVLIGEKTISEWAVDMDATKCQELVAPAAALSANSQPKEARKSIVVGDPSSLRNILEEQENLAKALSGFLDNLAEEVSVCSGLLLVGSGATALASHVRSLKNKKEKLFEKLERHNEAYSNSQDELNYWIQQCGGKVEFPKFKEPAESILQDTQLEAQIAACQTKIRMLRASIADLSEENARNLEAVQKRGLSGGINLVRNLRDEIREIEFCLSEATSGEASCRTKIQYIQSNLETLQSKLPDANVTKPEPNEEHGKEGHDKEELSDESDDGDMPESAKIASGKSTAIVIREPGNHGGLLTIWQILLRIIGLSDPDSSESRPAMIV